MNCARRGIRRVNKSGFPTLIEGKPGYGDRNRAALKIAEAAARVSGRARDWRGRARVELSASEVAANHVVSLTRGNAIQLNIGRGIEKGRGVVPLLTVLVDRSKDKPKIGL